MTIMKMRTCLRRRQSKSTIHATIMIRQPTMKVGFFESITCNNFNCLADNYNQLIGDLSKEKPKRATPVKKREVKPRVKYTEYDLIGPKGLVALKRTFEGYKLPSDGKAPASVLLKFLCTLISTIFSSMTRMTSFKRWNCGLIVSSRV